MIDILTIQAVCTNGTYKGENLEITMGSDSEKTSIKVNGKDLDNVESFCISMEAGEPCKITLKLFDTKQ